MLSSAEHGKLIVVFDSSPLYVTAEASILQRHVGQVVVVVQANKTPRHAVHEALAKLDSSKAIGLLLNRVVDMGSNGVSIVLWPRSLFGLILGCCLIFCADALAQPDENEATPPDQTGVFSLRVGGGRSDNVRRVPVMEESGSYTAVGFLLDLNR